MSANVVFVIVAAVVGLLCIAWFLRAHGPWRLEGKEGEPEDPAVVASRSFSAPADAGAEDQRTELRT